MTLVVCEILSKLNLLCIIHFVAIVCIVNLNGLDIPQIEMFVWKKKRKWQILKQQNKETQDYNKNKLIQRIIKKSTINRKQKIRDTIIKYNIRNMIIKYNIFIVHHIRLINNIQYISTSSVLNNKHIHVSTSYTTYRMQI
eukprot:UN09099